MAGRLTSWAEVLTLPACGRLAAMGPRSRRVGLAAVSALGGRFVGLLVQVLQVPLIVAAAGIDLYGEAAAAMALLGLLAACDLGFGAAVKNAAAEMVGRHEAEDLSDLVFKAAAWSSGVGAAAGGIIVAAPVLLSPLPGSDSILPLLTADAATRWLSAGLVTLAIPLATATHCVEGMQLAWLVNACRMAAAVMGLGIIVALASVVSQRWQVVALLGAVPLLAGIATCYALWRHLPRRRLLHHDGVSLVRLVRDGVPFVLPIVASLLVVNAPHLAILAADGSPAVTRYVVGQRMMTIFIQPLTFLITPLWPAFAEARATGDREWVARQIRRASWAAIAYAAAVTMVGIGCGRWLATVWMGRVDAVPFVDEMTAIAVAAGITAVVQPGAMLLNAYRQFRMSTVVAILQIGLAFAYEPLARVAGPAAVPATQAIFGLLVVVPAVIVESRAALRQ
jgi:O-antigen/teichoic acid export membrane protein